MKKRDLLKRPVEHVDITSFDATPIIDSPCAGCRSVRGTPPERPTSLSACSEDRRLHHHPHARRQHQRRRLHAGLRRHGPVQHGGRDRRDRRLHRGHGLLRGPGVQPLPGHAPRRRPRAARLYIDRIYDTYIDEEAAAALRHDRQGDRRSPGAPALLLARVHPRDGPIPDLERKKGSLVELAYDSTTCRSSARPSSDSSAGFGLVMHQVERPEAATSRIDSVRTSAN